MNKADSDFIKGEIIIEDVKSKSHNKIRKWLKYVFIIGLLPAIGFPLLDYLSGERSTIFLIVQGVSNYFVISLVTLWGIKNVNPIRLYKNGIAFVRRKYFLILFDNYYPFKKLLFVYESPSRSKARNLMNVMNLSNSKEMIGILSKSIIFQFEDETYHYLTKKEVDSYEDLSRILKSLIDEGKWIVN